MAYRVTILTLFPEMFPGPLGVSITGRALNEGKWALDVVNIRDSATDRHRTVDDTPYGGGAGMVMKADIVAAAIRKAKEANPKARVAFMAPAGRPFKQADAERLSREEGLILLCGHYEGIDQRVLDALVDEELSIGDYVLTGGEVPAMVITDAVVRQLGGVLGNAETLHEESFDDGLLEYPHYTRPEVWEGQRVPDVLLSGHHGNIAKWRLEQARARTAERRPDLLEKKK
ncbi:MAG: tRNA (guanosine(37)-N1)-methyltransferase TrmD [Proteobacteria bacterium]|nr:tRNA (guanosine(37)-N1)-methyltransferase TrmD [Pseudomonadota bacterium]